MATSPMRDFDLPQIVKSTDISHVDFHTRLDSTNDRALELVKCGCDDFPLLILTSEQSAGRGQGTRKWIAGKGSLSFTVCIPLSSLMIEDSQALRVPLTVGLAVCESVEAVSRLPNVQLKWPNDVMIGGKKCAGILIEKAVGPAGTVLVIGIGLNVNNEINSMQILENDDSESVTEPTSLHQETNSIFDLNDLLIRLLNQLFMQLNRLRSTPEEIIACCRARFFLLDRLIDVEIPGGKNLTGTCLGIGASGELLIDSPSGSQAIFSGRVRVTPPTN